MEDNRDDLGWKISDAKLKERRARRVAAGEAEPDNSDLPSPEVVKAWPRLFADVEALQELTRAESPPWRRVRPKKSAVVSYGFGDASGTAFGAASKIAGSEEFHFQFGQWPSRVTEEESSNWREFTNLVEYLEERGQLGVLDDAEVFMFTDNSTAERAFWKGSSHSPKLCELVLRLRKLEMHSGVIIHLIHVSGTRMIRSGIDGISRGDHTTGIMEGEDLVSFVPVHLTAFERSPCLRPWLEDVLEGHNAKFLTPEGWFEGADSEGTFVWCPAPAAADLVVERLGTARHKRPNSLHLVVVPRLMTGYWRKALLKATDCDVKINSGSLWNLKVQHEPLLIFFCFPFLPHRPDFGKRKSDSQGLHRILLEEGVPEAHSELSRDLLRKLLFGARALPCM